MAAAVSHAITTTATTVRNRQVAVVRCFVAMATTTKVTISAAKAGDLVVLRGKKSFDCAFDQL